MKFFLYCYSYSSSTLEIQQDYCRTCWIFELTLLDAKDKFYFLPLQDFSKAWTDEELYAKYGLTEDEIAFIESMIRPME